MGTYRKKPNVIEATQWFKNGDHPGDNVWRCFEDTGLVPTEPREGAIVRYFRRPDVPGEKQCPRGCGRCMNDHGWIDVVGDRFSGFTVCPGDYVVTDANGDVYPSKPAFFEEMYELVPPWFVEFERATELDGKC